MRLLLLIWLPLAIAYGVTMAWVVDRWNAPTQYYQHGWLLPLVAAFVIVSRRDRWSRSMARTDLRAFWLLVPGLLLHLAGGLLMIDSLSASSLILVIPGAAWLTLGPERLRGLWPVLLLVIFAVPPPMYVEGRVGHLLKELAVGGGATVANWLGAGVTRVGANLQLDGTTESLFVAEACGGLRSLLAMITLGYCVAFLFGGRSTTRRVLLMLITVPVAVGANVLRIAVLCLMARAFGVSFAEGIGHTMANVAEWVFDICVLLAFDAFLSRRLERGGDAQPATATVASSMASTALRGPSLLLWLLAGPMLWLSLYRPAGGGEDRAERLPETVAGYSMVQRTEAEAERFERSLPRWIELLGTDDFVWRRYRSTDGGRISLVALFHDANWKSVHPPRICIEGSNMEIEIDDLLAAPWLGDDATASRIVARSRTDGWQYLTLSVFGTLDWSAGSYSEFAWHHMPLALMRRPQSGFLLRVETPVWPNEPLEVAQRRCQEFLGELLPAAREVLR